MPWIGKSVTSVRANSLKTSESCCSSAMILHRPKGLCGRGVWAERRSNVRKHTTGQWPMVRPCHSRVVTPLSVTYQAKDGRLKLVTSGLDLRLRLRVTGHQRY